MLGYHVVLCLSLAITQTLKMTAVYNKLKLARWHMHQTGPIVSDKIVMFPITSRKACIRTTHLNTELQWHFSLRVKPTCSICSICWASHYIHCQASLELLHCNNSHIPWQSVWNRAWQKCVCVCLCVAFREKFNSNIAERWGWGDGAGLVNLPFISLWNCLCV